MTFCLPFTEPNSARHEAANSLTLSFEDYERIYAKAEREYDAYRKKIRKGINNIAWNHIFDRIVAEEIEERRKNHEANTKGTK